MSHILIIGYGNPSRRDDGVGHYIIEKITQMAGEKIDCLACHQLGIELADTIKDYDRVIFVDAHVSDFPEEIKVVSVDATYSTSAFTHSIKPGSLVALAKSLYQKEPQALVVSVRGNDFDFGTELSAETRKWADVAVARILEMADGKSA